MKLDRVAQFLLIQETEGSDPDSQRFNCCDPSTELGHADEHGTELR